MKKLSIIPVIIALIAAIPVSSAFADDSLKASSLNDDTEIRIGYEIYDPEVKAEDSILEPFYETLKWSDVKGESIPDDGWVNQHAPSSASELKGYELGGFRITSYPDDNIINILYYYYKNEGRYGKSALEHIKMNTGVDVVEEDDLVETFLNEVGEEEIIEKYVDGDGEDLVIQEPPSNTSSSSSSNTSEENSNNQEQSSNQDTSEDPFHWELILFCLFPVLIIFIIIVVIRETRQS